MKRIIAALAAAITLYMPASHEALAESPTASLDDLKTVYPFIIDENLANMRKLTDLERLERLKVAEHKAEVKRLKAERQAEAERKERARLARLEAERQAKDKAERERLQAATNATLSVEVTFFTAYCYGCSGITATGDNVRNSIYVNGYRVIAVDPRVIPLRSIVRVTLANGQTFEAVASDTGGMIKGRIIDVLVASKSEAYALGRQSATVEILRNGGR